jgi:hypothetical protein
MSDTQITSGSHWPPVTDDELRAASGLSEESLRALSEQFRGLSPAEAQHRIDMAVNEAVTQVRDEKRDAIDAAIRKLGPEATRRYAANIGTEDQAEPRSPEQWQLAVDSARTVLLIDSAQKYGLVEGGPKVRQARAIDLLERGESLGFHPRDDQTLIAEYLAEQDAGLNVQENIPSVTLTPLGEFVSGRGEGRFGNAEHRIEQ